MQVVTICCNFIIPVILKHQNHEMNKFLNRKRYAILDLALGAASAAQLGEIIRIKDEDVITLSTALDHAPLQQSTVASIRQRIRKGEVPFVKQLDDGRSGSYYIVLSLIDKMISE